MMLKRRTANMAVRDRRRVDLVGEVLPPERSIIPWEEAEIQAARRSAPMIAINLPRAPEADDPAPVLEYTARKLQREPNLEGDVWVPVFQATATAFSVVILAALAASLFDWGWRVVAWAFGVALAFMLLARFKHVDSLLWSVETVVQHDITGDGKVGDPRAYTLANPGVARSAAARTAAAVSQDERQAELRMFLMRCYAVGCGERAHGVSASGPDRQTYCRNRDALFALGLAAWKNPQRPKAGWHLTLAEAEALHIVSEHVL